MNGSDAGGIVALFFFCGAILIPIALGIALLSFMIYAVVHAATHKMDNQAIWLVLIIVGGPIGAIAYFIAKPYKGGT